MLSKDTAFTNPPSQALEVRIISFKERIWDLYIRSFRLASTEVEEQIVQEYQVSETSWQSGTGNMSPKTWTIRNNLQSEQNTLTQKPFLEWVFYCGLFANLRGTKNIFCMYFLNWSNNYKLAMLLYSALM